MSADNWAECPKCNAKKLEEIKTLKQELHNSQVPQASLREDYEIGICEGEFYVNYGAYCSKCEFEFTYNYSEDLTKKWRF